jgi:hypothetical protein
MAGTGICSSSGLSYTWMMWSNCMNQASCMCVWPEGPQASRNRNTRDIRYLILRKVHVASTPKAEVNISVHRYTTAREG